MPTESECAINASGQLKNADDIDWYQSESDTRALPRLAMSALPVNCLRLARIDLTKKDQH